MLISSIIPAILFTLYGLFLILNSAHFEKNLNELLVMFLLVTYVAGLHFLILGLPIYLIIKKYFCLTYKKYSFFGFTIGATPLAIFTWPLSDADSKSSFSYNGIEHVVDGIPTIAGWLLFVQEVLVFGFLGLVSALVYGYLLAVLKKPNKALKAQPSAAGTPQSGAL